MLERRNLWDRKRLKDAGRGVKKARRSEEAKVCGRVRGDGGGRGDVEEMGDGGGRGDGRE